MLEMARIAAKRGIKVIAFTDHSVSLGVTGGLSMADHKKQAAEIKKIQKQLGDSIRVLHATEVEIKADGSLDYPDDFLASLDLVLASLHTSLRQPREKIMLRLLNAVRNPHVDIIGHPTGRLIPDREGADVDMDALLKAAAKTGVALEINAHWSRLDLEDMHARRAKELGIPISINTDAHSEADFDVLFYGVATARRAWLEPKDVINCWPPEKLLKWLKDRGGMPDAYCVILTTVGSREEADRLAELLGHAQAWLPACRSPPSHSLYTWKGELHKDAEHLLLIKTDRIAMRRVEAAIRENHSYEVPEIVQLPIERVGQPTWTGSRKAPPKVAHSGSWRGPTSSFRPALSATAARTSSFNAASFSLSPSLKSIDRVALASRPLLKSFLGSASDAPLKKFSFT